MPQALLIAIVGGLELVIALVIWLNLRRFEAFMRLMYSIVKLDQSLVPSPPLAFPVGLAVIGIGTLVVASLK